MVRLTRKMKLPLVYNNKRQPFREQGSELYLARGGIMDGDSRFALRRLARLFGASLAMTVAAEQGSPADLLTIHDLGGHVARW